jgi:hypothetical protein
MVSGNPLPIAEELTPHMHAFAAEYATCGNASAALRRVYGGEFHGRTDVAIRKEAHRLSVHPGVVARVAQLRRIAAEALNTSVAELALQAHEIASASAHDLQPIEIYGCRHCHGIDGRYQWRDAGELAAAIDVHLKGIGGPKPLPLPCARGGFGCEPACNSDQVRGEIGVQN